MNNEKDIAASQFFRGLALFVLAVLAEFLCVLPAAVCFNLSGGYGFF